MSHTQTKFAQDITAHAAARYWRATLARDSRADGSFVLAVRSTRIYCRPSCPARRPLRRNVTFFRTREEAEKQGYRPCLRCRPNEVAGPVSLVQRAAHQAFQSHAPCGKEYYRCVVRNRVWIIEPRLRAQQRAAWYDPGDLSKGRTGYEDPIHHCEIAARESFGGGDGAGSLGGLSGRR